MEPASTIVLILTATKQLLDLIALAREQWWARSSRSLQSELQLFRTQLDAVLAYVKGTFDKASALGVNVQHLEILEKELQKFVSSAEDLFNGRCKKEAIQQFRMLVLGTFQYLMTCTNMEIHLKTCQDGKDTKQMLAKLLEKLEPMPLKPTVQINIFHGKALNDQMLMGVLSPFVCNMPYPTETFLEDFRDVLAIDHTNHLAPAQSSKVYEAGHGVVEVEKSGRLLKEGAGKDVLEEEEEEEKNRKCSVILSRNEIQKKEEALLKEDLEKWGRRTTDEEPDNPNHNMKLDIEEGKGELRMYVSAGNQFELTYKWLGDSMRMVIGKRPMEVSQKLSYFYFEVKLVEMVELLQEATGLAGWGVGLTRRDQFQTRKMAGKYPNSCGYVSSAGEVYYENKPKEVNSRMGHLAKGETIGIGLLRHQTGQNPIFFARNGRLRVCIHEHSLDGPSRHGGLHPVISLASAHVQVHVNFHGPFPQLPQLLEEVEATLRRR